MVKEEICKISGNKMFYYNTVTTTDGVKVHITVYNITCDIHKKGIVSYKECKEAYKQREEIEKKTSRYNLLMRKKAIGEGNQKALPEILKAYLIKEREYCLEQFKKVRGVITGEEYLQMVEHFIKELVQFDGVRTTDDLKLYKWGENYRKRIALLYPTNRVKEVYLL